MDGARPTAPHPQRCPRAPGGRHRLTSRRRIGDGPWMPLCSWCGFLPTQQPKTHGGTKAKRKKKRR